MVEAFIKPERADGQPEINGLNVLDEPTLNQTDPTVLELNLRQNLKTKAAHNVVVRSIEEAHKNPRQITRWINSVNDLHKNVQPHQVQFSKQMPDPDIIMQVWPTEMEDALSEIDLPDPSLEIDLGTYAKILLNVLDVPVYDNNPNNKGLIESLHLMFSVLMDFEENIHFQALGGTNNDDEEGQENIH